MSNEIITKNQAFQGLLEKSQAPVLEPIKYCLYARKSSEDDERQALSIDSQIKEMLANAERDGMEVVEIRRESHSAKASGMRPIYNQLLIDIRAGMFNGILTWAPDRLSRNAGDLGTLVDLMDQGLLKEIRTQGQRFTNSPSEKFLLMILCSQAKLENDNKGVNVKRGQRAKLEMGHRPCMAPLGYINEKLVERGKSRILLDPKRAQLVKQMFEKVANNFYTGRDIYEWAQQVKLTTRTGKRVTLSSIYRMLDSPFYYGEFEWPLKSGNWYQGKHEPLISKQLFEKARGNLGAPHRNKPGNKEFDFTRLMHCGSCGSGVTAEEKFKKISDGSLKRYVYYHCTKFNDYECQEPFIREEDLLAELLKIADKIDLNESKTKLQLQSELEKFQRFSQGVLGKMLEEQNLIPKIDIQSYAKYVLMNGTREEKRSLLSGLKSGLRLKGRKLYISKEKKQK
jgi:DNA invertase Pin-like site-specific DNA recombinase